MAEKEIPLEEIIATETEVDKAINKLNNLNRKRGLLCDVFLSYRIYENSHCNDCGLDKEILKHVLCSSYDVNKNERIANIIQVEEKGYMKDEYKFAYPILYSGDFVVKDGTVSRKKK